MTKKSDITIIIFFILIGIVLIGGTAYLAYREFVKPQEAEKKLISLDLYGYTLVKGDTDLFKEKFKELEKVLNEEVINYNEYAKLASELFIIDVYSLNNKLTSTDIGGLEFVHKDLRENFKENLGNTLYKNVVSNLNGKRTQKLPEVSSIQVDNIIESKYTYKKTEYDAYVVTLSWEYKQDLGYEKKLKVTLIKDNGKLFIVKGE